jgi:hypothetical protein
MELVIIQYLGKLLMCYGVSAKVLSFVEKGRVRVILSREMGVGSEE